LFVSSTDVHVKIRLATVQSDVLDYAEPYRYSSTPLIFVFVSTTTFYFLVWTMKTHFYNWL
jgi:hypothetical protein